MMNVTDLIQSIYDKYRGKAASKTPLAGSEKYATALRVANNKQSEWAKDSTIAWVSNFRTTAPNEPGTVATTGTTTLTGTGTYFTDYKVGDKVTVSGETVRTIDAITSDTVLTVSVAFANTASGLTFTKSSIIATGVQNYSLHRDFYVPSDNVVVTTTTQDIPLNFAKPQARNDADVYISGRDPKVLTFNTDIESTSSMVGGTLEVPGYYLPESLVNASDLVSVDDPEWLAYATAAELARNDAAKQGQFPNLLGMANERYKAMIAANNALGYLQDKKITTNMPSLGDQSGDNWSI
jgi:preprotein translocase subunit YajC